MNSIYMLVEGGQTEPILYRAWMPALLSESVILKTPEESETRFGVYIVSGYGYPSILSRIDAALEDLIQFRGFSRLLVCLDCEERTVEEVQTEVMSRLNLSQCPVAVNVIVANCAIESWLLGNRRFVKRAPTHEPLLTFMREFNVTENDPELLPNLRPLLDNTRAQFHKRYLRAAFSEHGLSYSERRPGQAATPDYLRALIARARDNLMPPHLQTFFDLLTAIHQHQESSLAQDPEQDQGLLPYR